MAEQTVTMLVSADDHVLEAPDIWQDRLPQRYLDVAPRIDHERGMTVWKDGSAWLYSASDEGRPCDVWRYEDKTIPIWGGYGASRNSP